MSLGGHSLHKKDWLTLAAAVAATATGAGAAGAGPLAGLLGSSPAAAGAGGAMELASVGEAMGMGAGAAAPTGTIGGLGGLLGSMGGAGKMNPAKLGMLGMSMMGGGQQPMAAPMGPRPGMQQQIPNTVLPTLGKTSLTGNMGGMPPELIGLPPDDPRVQAWMLKQQQMMG